MYNLSKKIIIVTGATSGIGLAAVDSYVRSGANVIGIGRSVERIENARKQVLDKVSGGRLIYLKADFGNLDQVRSCANEISSILKNQGINHIDALVNNAGLYLERKTMTNGGLEMTFVVNHLAAFYLTYLLLPMLSQSENGRVLTVSSYSHKTTPLMLSRITRPWPYLSLIAYKRSKLCNVLFTYEFNRRCNPITAFAVDPGLVNTGIASKGGNGISHWVWRTKRKKGTSADVPAQTLMYLAAEKDVDLSYGYYFKDSAPKPCSKKAQDPRLASSLWDLSCKLLNIDWSGC